jgi:hypothetical protein
MLFAHLKRFLNLGELRLCDPSGAHDEFLLAATAQNLRRMAKKLLPTKQNMQLVISGAPPAFLRNVSFLYSYFIRAALAYEFFNTTGRDLPVATGGHRPVSSAATITGSCAVTATPRTRAIFPFAAVTLACDRCGVSLRTVATGRLPMGANQRGVSRTAPDCHWFRSRL